MSEWKETEVGKVPSDWVVTEIENLAEIIDPHPSHRAPKEVKDGFPFAGIGDINENGDILVDKARKIDCEFVKKQEDDYQINEYSIGYGRVGTVGKVVKLKRQPYRYALSPTLAVINPLTHVNGRFVYFLIKNKAFYYSVVQCMTGTTRPAIGIQLLRKILVAMPERKEQNEIASILSSLDSKIELLRKQNQTLENIAQTLFKRWFIDFEFPNEDGKPYKSSGGKMVDSELAEIPERWRVIELTELVYTLNGCSYKGTELQPSNIALVTLKNFDRNGGFKLNGFKEFTGKYKETQIVSHGDLVVAHTDLTQDAEVLGNPIIVYQDKTYEKLIITMDLVKVIPKSTFISNAFLYYLMKDIRFKNHCMGYSNGTTVLHLSKRAIPEYLIALPIKTELLVMFSKLTSSIIDKVMSNIERIQTLTKTRDTLLPKLMSGQIRVKTDD